MECRAECGACCIAISIHQPFYAMPKGKPAGISCVHLSPDMRCILFGDARRPDLCDAFEAEREFCGYNREQALVRLVQLERQSLPDIVILRGGR